MSSAAHHEYGFTDKDGVDWSKYVQYRPIYPPSYFERLFEYHAQKIPGASWAISHDVGAGAGICSGTLSRRFEHVVVSDPNEYITLARKALTEEAGLPESQFTFLRESAECSTAKSGSIDLLVAAECIHWTDTHASIKEFHRQLKGGGSLLISYYTRPRLPERRDAEKAWDRLFPIMAGKAVASGNTEVVNRAFDCTNTGLASLEFPEDQWASVKRVYINTRGTLDTFFMWGNKLQSKVKGEEDIEWLENASDWNTYQGVEWLKGYISTYIPRLPEEEVRGIWDEIEASLNGEMTLIEFPVAIVMATKKA